MASTERERAARSRGATPEQLREAERGLRQVLAPTFSARWIAQNVLDLLNEANVEYAEWLGEHRPASNPPGWLVQRARWRAIDLVERENRRAGPSLDSVIHSAEDPHPTPEESALERDRHRRIAEALAHLPERDRKLLALVYYEGHSIRAAGRLLGWGKSNVDSHHAAAMRRLRALVGPRELLSPSLLGLLAQASVLRDRRGLLGGISRRVSAAVQDLADLLARTFGSAGRNAGEAARRALPFTDAGTATVAGGGAGRLIAQCGALAGAVICSVILVSSPPVEQVLPHHRPAPIEEGPSRSGDRSGGPESNLSTPGTGPAPVTEEASRSATARSEEARRIERRGERRRRRAGRRRRRRAKIADAQRVREQKAKAKAARVRRNESIEAPEEVAPEASEPAPESVAPPIESSPPPPATGGQTRQEFGL